MNQLENKKTEFLKIYGDIIEFEDVINKLDNPNELGYSDELLDASQIVITPVINGWKGAKIIYAEDYKDFFKYAHGVRLRRVAYKVLPTNLAGADFIVDLTRGWPSTTFSYQDFMAIYTLLENLYYLQVGRQIGSEDLKNIYFSGLDERLVFCIDEFNIIEDNELPVPTKNFFKVIKNVKYQDDILKNLFMDFEYLIGSYLVKKFNKGAYFLQIQQNVIKTLIFSSAVTDGRNEIMAEDIIKAYNAYFKLLQTDVTQYSIRKDVFESTNYNSLKSRFVQFSLRIGILYG